MPDEDLDAIHDFHSSSTIFFIRLHSMQFKYKLWEIDFVITRLE